MDSASGYTDGGFTSVSCPSVSFCAAVDYSGNVATSTDPTGGASSWKSVQIDYATVLCEDNSTCPAPLFGISCPSVSLCVAIDALGNVLTSKNPSAGAPVWTSANVDPKSNYMFGSGGEAGISCPSASFCTAYEYDTGDVLTSSQPTGGSDAWTVASLGDPNGLLGVTCASSSLCVIGDRAGNVLTSSDPSAGASAWTTTNIDATNPVTGISCPTASFCVAVDYVGNIVIGAWPPPPTPPTITPPPTVSPTTTPPPATVSIPTASQIRALLRRELDPSGRWTRIPALRKHDGYSFSCKALSAGRVQISWYQVPKGAHLTSVKPKPVQIATGKATFARAGTIRIKIELTRKGKRLLKHAKHLKMTAKGTFTPTTTTTVVTTRTFRLSR